MVDYDTKIDPVATAQSKTSDGVDIESASSTGVSLDVLNGQNDTKSMKRWAKIAAFWGVSTFLGHWVLWPLPIYASEYVFSKTVCIISLELPADVPFLDIDANGAI